MKQAISRVSTGLSDARFDIQDIVAEGDRVAVRLTSTATQTGDFMGMPPTGAGYTIEEIHLFRISDGRIAEHWHQGDMLGMMRQLGLMPEPARPRDSRSADKADSETIRGGRAGVNTPEANTLKTRRTPRVDASDGVLSGARISDTVQTRMTARRPWRGIAALLVLLLGLGVLPFAGLVPDPLATDSGLVVTGIRARAPTHARISHQVYGYLPYWQLDGVDRADACGTTC